MGFLKLMVLFFLCVLSCRWRVEKGGSHDPRSGGSKDGGSKSKGAGSKRVGVRRGWGPEGWGSDGWGARILALLILSPIGNFTLSSLSWAGILVVDPQMCPFGVLGLLCEDPAAPKQGSWIWCFGCSGCVGGV